jgi:hypothetical protein
MSLFNFFSKDPKKLFMEFLPDQATWKVMSWNFNLKNSTQREWSVELVGKEAKLIKWHSRQGHEELDFFTNSKMDQKVKINKQREELKTLFNLASHLTLKAALEEKHEFILAPVSGATTLDFQNEQRALQWIQASFGTLYRALEQFKIKPDLILTGIFFSGSEPETGKQVTRLLMFNLDIFLYYEEDSSLRVLIFDDKDLGHGSSKQPSFQQIIKVTKPQIYDEIIKLVQVIANLGEVR